MNRSIKTSLLVVTIMSLFILSLASSVLFSTTFNEQINVDVVEENYKVQRTLLTSKISNSKFIDKESSLENSFSPKTITPTNIIRGNTFIATGHLEDPDTGLGLPNEPIEVFWSSFSWAAYEADYQGLVDDYGVGSGTTDSNGDFSINCRDTDYSKDYGAVTVYTVFRGDYLLGPIEDNRQFTSESVECYIQVQTAIIDINATQVREEEYFYTVAGLGYYEDSAPVPVPSSNGQDISFIWLGSTYTDTIVSFITNTTFYVPLGTALTQHTLEASFNISLLGLSYATGTNNEALIGTPTADWANTSVAINVYSGAGITFNVDDPIDPGFGLHPTILRDVTSVTISGLIEDSNGNPYASAVNLEIYVDQGSTQTATTMQSTAIAAGGTGIFSSTFTITGTYLPTGDCNIWVDAETGQGIVATPEIEQLTVVGNSSMINTQANGTNVLTETFQVMPGENIEVSGTMEDVYDSRGIEGMIVSAYWEGSGSTYDDNTTSTGAYSITLPVPLSFTAVDSQGTIIVEATETTHYNASSTSFSVDIFVSVNFAVELNTTAVIEDAGYNQLDGNPIHNNSTFTLRANLTDQFARAIVDRAVNITFESYGSSTRTLSSSGSFSYFFAGDETLLTNVDYTVTITFNANIDFNFRVNFQNYPTPTDTGVTPTTASTTPGGDGLGTVLIIILIAMVSGIIIVSTIYAFGRFRKSKKQPGAGTQIGQFDLSTILKQIDESENAKDYKRAAVLCYRAFEAISIRYFGVVNARSTSPRELARIVASTNRVPVRDVTMLVMRFEEARYSNHKITKNSYTQARQALHNLQLSVEKPSKNPTG